MENDRTAKGIHVEVCAGNRSVGSLWKIWIETVKDCLRKKRFGCEASKENGAG